jgi:Flp pilus assembly protein TadB
MSFAELISIIILCAAGGYGVWIMLHAGRRTAEDVSADLWEQSGNTRIPAPLAHDADVNEKDERKRISKERKIGGYIFGDDFANAGLIEPTERRNFQLRMQLTPLVVLSVIVLLQLVFLPNPSIRSTAITLVLGLSVGVLYARAELRKKARRYCEELEFFLPLVMERLVMAVQAGLDIIPAIGSVVEVSKGDTHKRIDPVSRLLQIVYQLAESGAGFERSLKEVAAHVQSSGLRHAFIHLALAQKEGGELVMPLRELSDSTQIYYQESIEENIAKMPVKATVPLLCTFTGLILSFLAGPIVQVTTMLGNTQFK